MKIRTILVAVDFGPCSPALVHDAVELATDLGARLVLMHAVEPPSGAAGVRFDAGHGVEPAWEALVHEAGARLARVDTEGVETTRVAWPGRPVQAILQAAEECGADLVMLGTHGRQGLAHLVLGSVAERVVRTSPVPVLTVRSTHREGCEAASCNWCTTGPSPARQQLDAETEG